MTNYGVKKRLLNDSRGIQVPDVWGRLESAPIAVAVRRGQRSYFAVAVVLSAFVLVAVTSALLIPRMTAGWNTDLPLTGSVEIDGDYTAKGDAQSGHHSVVGEAVVSSAPVTEEQSTTLQWLSAQQYHGELRQTTMSESDVSSMLATNFDLENVYEDETYLYAFEMSGALKEMVNTCDGLGSGMADETAIRSAVALCFEQYLPDENLSEYEITIDGHEDAYPAWTVKAKKYTDEIVVSNVLLTFDSDGRLLHLTAQDADVPEEVFTGAISLLSHKDAVQIALAEAEKEEYGLIVPEDYSASIETRTRTESGETIVYYSVKIGNLSLKSTPFCVTALGVDVDMTTGEVIEIHRYK